MTKEEQMLCAKVVLFSVVHELFPACTEMLNRHCVLRNYTAI